MKTFTEYLKGLLEEIPSITPLNLNSKFISIKDTFYFIRNDIFGFADLYGIILDTYDAIQLLQKKYSDSIPVLQLVQKDILSEHETLDKNKSWHYNIILLDSYRHFYFAISLTDNSNPDLNMGISYVIDRETREINKFIKADYPHSDVCKSFYQNDPSEDIIRKSCRNIVVSIYNHIILNDILDRIKKVMLYDI